MRASQTEWLEIPVFIHGISPEEDPQDNSTMYEGLRQKVNAALLDEGKEPLSDQPIYIEWGKQTPGATSADQYLAKAEKILNKRIRESMGDADYTGPFSAYKSARETIYFGLTDIFYYVSEDGEKALREHVFGDIMKQALKLKSKKSAGLSLTIFAHSAGSLIAHDFLYHVFGKTSSENESAKIVNRMDKARVLGNPDDPDDVCLRVRRLYTFGSPIAMVFLRANSLVKMMGKDQTLNPESIGLRASDGLDGPRWVNFWDKDDLISSPLAQLYKNEDGVIVDQHIDAGWIMPRAHTDYWYRDEMAKMIARTY